MYVYTISEEQVAGVIKFLALRCTRRYTNKGFFPSLSDPATTIYALRCPYYQIKNSYQIRIMAQNILFKEEVLT